MPGFIKDDEEKEKEQNRFDATLEQTVCSSLI